MGSGGMIVMDDTVCMVDVARYFMDFCREESCGKCVPCRVGTDPDVPDLLDKITDGQATHGRPRPARAAVATSSSSTSLCGLGQARPEPGLQHAALLPRRVPRAHRRPDVCPAGVCTIEPAEVVAMPTVHTFKIDGVDVAAAEGQTILDVATENGIEIPTLCHLDGLSDIGACRLCLVEVAGSQQAAARLHDHRRRGHGGHDQQRAARRLPAHDRRDALRRAQPRLRGVRRQRPLRAAGPGRGAGRHHFDLPTDQPGGRRSTRATSCSPSTTTAASCAPAACASATRSRGRTPGT